MDKLEYLNKFKNRKSVIMENYKDSSVLLPLVKVDGELHILFEVRAKTLRSQPGDVSLPGGKRDEGESTLETAIRETEEELNIGRNKINIIGTLDYIVMSYGMTIYGYVGILEDVDINNINYNKDEVDHVFTVPVSFFKENVPERYTLELKLIHDEEFPYHLIKNGKKYKWKDRKEIIRFYRYNEYTIWGITAAFIENFIDILEDWKTYKKWVIDNYL